MIDPTREEWLSARERVLAMWPHNVAGDTHWDKVVVAVLGPCPPEPAPKICWRALVGQETPTAWPLCQRPKGHAGICKAASDA